MWINHNLVKLAVMAAVIGTLTAGRGEFRIDRFGHSEIRWIDLVQVNGQMYHRDETAQEIDVTDLGDKIGEVNFTINDKVTNPDYRIRNGDASFLEEGTELFWVDAQGQTVAARVGQKLYLYRISK